MSSGSFYLEQRHPGQMGTLEEEGQQVRRHARGTLAVETRRGTSTCVCSEWERVVGQPPGPSHGSGSVDRLGAQEHAFLNVPVAVLLQTDPHPVHLAAVAETHRLTNRRHYFSHSGD